MIKIRTKLATVRPFIRPSFSFSFLLFCDSDPTQATFLCKNAILCSNSKKKKKTTSFNHMFDKNQLPVLFSFYLRPESHCRRCCLLSGRYSTVLFSLPSAPQLPPQLPEVRLRMWRQLQRLQLREEENKK